jgi:hypothetical protein
MLTSERGRAGRSASEDASLHILKPFKKQYMTCGWLYLLVRTGQERTTEVQGCQASTGWGFRNKPVVRLLPATASRGIMSACTPAESVMGCLHRSGNHHSCTG